MSGAPIFRSLIDLPLQHQVSDSQIGHVVGWVFNLYYFWAIAQSFIFIDFTLLFYNFLRSRWNWETKRYWFFWLLSDLIILIFWLSKTIQQLICLLVNLFDKLILGFFSKILKLFRKDHLSVLLWFLSMLRKFIKACHIIIGLIIILGLLVNIVVVLIFLVII